MDVLSRISCVNNPSATKWELLELRTDSQCPELDPGPSLPKRTKRQGSGYIREQSGARERGPESRAAVSTLVSGRPKAPESPPRPHPCPAPACAPAKDPQHQHGLLHRERVLQAGRRHSRHPAGRSWRQRGRCQNPGEFPGPHGKEEDKERRARPEGPGPRGNGRSWGRPGRRGRRPQRRLGQN